MSTLKSRIKRRRAAVDMTTVEAGLQRYLEACRSGPGQAQALRVL